MGRDSEAVCLDCKERHYLGYGSCLTWFDQAESIEDWDAQAKAEPNAATLHKNQLFRRFLEKHDGHKFLTWSSDWCSVSNGRLLLDHDDSQLADLTGFSYTDEYNDKSTRAALRGNGA